MLDAVLTNGGETHRKCDDLDGDETAMQCRSGGVKKGGGEIKKSADTWPSTPARGAYLHRLFEKSLSVASPVSGGLLLVPMAAA